MYLRTTRRKNKNGSVAEYYQLAHNERHPVSRKPVARIIHNFGRSEDIDLDEMARLCKSIARVCGLEVVDQRRKFKALDSGRTSVVIKPGERRSENLTSKKQAYYIKELEETVVRLQDSEEKYKTIFDSANDEIAYIDTDGTIIEINDKVEDLFGYTREEVIGKNFADLGAISREDLQKTMELFRKISNGKPHQMEQIYAYHKNGTKIWIEGNASIIRKNNKVNGILVIIRDITERKNIEKSLLKHRDQLEELVRERTENLEEANTALKVLLKRREDDRIELEEKILLNVKELVFPFIEKLKTSRLSDQQKTFVDIMEYNLNDIISPFVKELSSKFLNLTATEIKVAGLVKQEKTTKEIAEILNMSTRTIDIHRYHIRKKLGLNKKKASLSTCLMALE